MSEKNDTDANYRLRQRAYADLRDQMDRQARWLKWTTALALVLATGAVGSNAWIATRTKVVPYVLEVNKLGESLVTKRLEASLPFDPALIKSQLARWVADWRIVYQDRRANIDRYTEVFAWTAKGSPAEAALSEHYRTNNPDERMKRETVMPTIEDVFPSGDETWTVRWFEDAVHKDGQAPSRTYWTVDIRIQPSEPKNEDELIRNPGRFLVTWYHGAARIVK